MFASLLGFLRAYILHGDKVGRKNASDFPLLRCKRLSLYEVRSLVKWVSLIFYIYVALLALNYNFVLLWAASGSTHCRQENEKIDPEWPLFIRAYTVAHGAIQALEEQTARCLPSHWA